MNVFQNASLFGARFDVYCFAVGMRNHDISFTTPEGALKGWELPVAGLFAGFFEAGLVLFL